MDGMFIPRTDRVATLRRAPTGDGPNRRRSAAQVSRTTPWTIGLACVWGLIALYVSPACADPFGIMVQGGTVALAKPHQTISLTKETVSVRLTRDTARVCVKLSFHNTGDATGVKMAFPEVIHPFETSRGHVEHLGPPQLQSFSWRIDGELMSPQVIEEKRGRRPREIGFENPDAARRAGAPLRSRFGASCRLFDHPCARLRWHILDVAFDRGQKRDMQFCYEHRHRWQTNPERPRAKGPNHYFRYVLGTGATWKGAISRVRFVLTFDFVPTLRRLPKEAKLDATGRVLAK